MVKSLILATLLGVASLGHARPAVYNPSVYNVLSQMEQMKLGVEEYNRNISPEKYQAMSKAVAESNSESAIAACPKSILIFARGTFEPGGLNNLGMLVGGPFFSALRSAIPGVQGIGVDYSNDVFGYLTGYLGGTTPGSLIMAKQLQAKVSECPNIKIIAGGYSQGAQVTHQALASVPQDVKDHIAAVIVFGDPMKGLAITGVEKDKIFTNCADTDPICAYLPIPLGAHLTYGSDTVALKKSSEFAKSHV